jgi:ribonucleoside-diphosphate reductase alpha chain
MDADHPDIMKFIECKQHEENKAKILLANGISPEEAYSTVAFQNTNHSIRVTDKFMEAVLKDGDWHLVNRGDKKKKKVKAKEILMRVAEVAWATGDPGIQFDDRMNKDNPVPSIGKINSTNPCSEFSAVDESSCDLASLNLMSFLRDGEINYEEMERVINLLVMAMDILIDAASYPTEKIREVTTSTRPLGLGFTNLGTLLISLGIPYGSPEGTSLAAAITKFITTAAYKKSIKLAAKHGSFKAFEENKNACMQIAKRLTDGNSDVCSGILEHGLRNSQLTLLAPTGTISFIMDAETTGLEPLFAHKMTKSLSGGGVMNIQATCINSLLIENDIDTTVRKELWPENIKKIAATANEISWEDHINMVAACQNYLNGAISKTINMPNSCKVEDIFDAYIYAWRQGLKAISIYRDGSKFMQPLQENKKKEEDKEIIAITKETKWIPVRKKLPDTCYGPQHKFNIGGFKGYIKVGTYEDGSPGQVFITASKSGSTMQGLLDSFATAISIGLQYGVPVEKFIEKFVGSQYSPSGYTQNENIRFTSSIVDYIFRWLQIEFFDEEENDHIEIKNNEPPAPLVKVILDGPNCTSCGGLTQRNGTCFVCTTCGATTGCS